MPVLAKFYGVVIKMYYIQAEHNPPHVHAEYNEYAAEIDIRNNEVLKGKLPPRALKLVQEWITLHREELIAVWETQVFKEIQPLE